VKNLLAIATMTAFLLVLCGHTSAGAFDEKDMNSLAQQTQESADKQSETATDEGSDEAEADEEDEYDDEDEYADEEDVELIPDPLIGVNTGLYHFNDKMYFWLLKPVARGYKFFIPVEFRSVIVNVFYNIRFAGTLCTPGCLSKASLRHPEHRKIGVTRRCP
jgi:phospholipid-binding lipoprotein MlaA